MLMALVQVQAASAKVAGVLALALAQALALVPAQGVHRISATITSASRQSSLVAVQASPELQAREACAAVVMPS
jgi:hypothetical protein